MTNPNCLRLQGWVEQALVLLHCKPVGHAGDVIADGAFQPPDGDEFLIRRRQSGRFVPVGVEEVGDDPLRLDLHPHDPEMAIQIVIEEILHLPVTPLHVLTVADDVVFQLLNLQRRFRLAFLEAPVGGLDDIGDEQAHQVADHAVAFHIVQVGTAPVEGLAQDLPQGDAFQHLRKDQAGTQPVVEVVRGVSQLVGNVADLRLEVASQRRVEIPRVRDVILRLMFDDAFARLPGQVEAGEFRVALLKFGDDAQRLLVVVEPAEILHQPVERDLAGVSKRRVSEVVRQADGLDQVLVGAQRPGQGAADLRHLQRMGESGAEIVALVVDEYLRLVFQAAEGGRVQNPIAVALESGAVFGLVIEVGAPLGVLAAHTVGSERFVLQLFEHGTVEVHGSTFQIKMSLR